MQNALKSLTRYIVALGLVILVTAAAGCEEDDPEVESARVPPGQGTEQSPFVLQPGDTYDAIPISAYGTYFFVVSETPADELLVIGTTAEYDLDLRLYNPLSEGFGGDDPCTPFLLTGNESCWMIGHPDFPDAFFTVTAPGSIAGEAAFGVSALVENFVFEFELEDGFVISSPAGFAQTGSSVSGTLAAPSQFMYYEVRDFDGFIVTFPGNVDPNNCDVHNGGFTSPETCEISNLTGTSPFRFDVNNLGTAAETFTLTLSTP